MRDLPEIARLLDLAAEGEGALAARCRVIAAREAATGWAPYAAVQAEMAALLGNPPRPEVLTRLAQAIRAGRFDAPDADRTKLEALLWRHAVFRMTENVLYQLDMYNF
jgi:hypothetical protein